MEEITSPTITSPDEDPVRIIVQPGLSTVWGAWQYIVTNLRTGEGTGGFCRTEEEARAKASKAAEKIR